MEPQGGESAVSTFPASLDLPDQVHEPREVGLALPRPQVDPEPRRVDRLAVLQAGIPDRLDTGRDRDLGISPVALPAGRIGAQVLRQVESLQLRGDPGRETAGVEERDRADPCAALAEGFPGRLDVQPHGRDHAHPRHDDPAFLTVHRSAPRLAYNLNALILIHEPSSCTRPGCAESPSSLTERASPSPPTQSASAASARSPARSASPGRRMRSEMIRECEDDLLEALPDRVIRAADFGNQGDERAAIPRHAAHAAD